VALTCVLLIPLDVYTLTYGTSIAPFMKHCYYSCFALLIFFAFVVIPFAYFFSEDVIDDNHWDEETCCSRTMRSIKYTSFSVIIVVVLILVGLLLEPGNDRVSSESDLMDWMNHLTDVHAGAPGARALLLVTAVLTGMGLSLCILYTGYGMAALPVSLIRGGRDLRRQRVRAEHDQERIRARKLQIQAKYSKYERLGRNDLRALSNLNRQEQLLQRTKEEIQMKDRSLAARISRLLAPFRFLLGVILLILSLLIVGSLVLTSIDKAFNSVCGINCGFVLDHPRVFNPTDQMLTTLSNVFPLDYIALGIIAVYFFIASLFGILRNGIRFMCVRVYSIEKGRTYPQALLLAALYMALMILSLAMELLTLSPQYATFGAQTFMGAAGPLPCAIAQGHKNPDGCDMSQISTIVAQITVSMPIFSLVFYVGNWLFITVFIICVVREFVRADDDDDDTSSTSDYKEDYELISLLSEH
jgi:LMBR1 domain-containing protein 1